MILKLRGEVSHRPLNCHCGQDTDPDSVSLVRPPNITIPNTLAALPSNQYATDFELVSGKNDFFDTCVAALAPAPAPAMLFPSSPKGDGAGTAGLPTEELCLTDFRMVCGPCDRNACRNGVFRNDLYAARGDEALLCILLRQTHASCLSRGAVCRKMRKALNAGCINKSCYCLGPVV